VGKWANWSVTRCFTQYRTDKFWPIFPVFCPAPSLEVAPVLLRFLSGRFSLPTFGIFLLFQLLYDELVLAPIPICEDGFCLLTDVGLHLCRLIAFAILLPPLFHVGGFRIFAALAGLSMELLACLVARCSSVLDGVHGLSRYASIVRT